jgi:hypothetical protein
LFDGLVCHLFGIGSKTSLLMDASGETRIEQTKPNFTQTLCG